MILEGTDNVYFSSEVSRFREVEQTRAYFTAVGIGLAETAETKGIIYDKFCIVTDAQSDIERMYREFEQEFDIMCIRNRSAWLQQRNSCGLCAETVSAGERRCIRIWRQQQRPYHVPVRRTHHCAWKT